jgi:hypothetical protein
MFLPGADVSYFSIPLWRRVGRGQESARSAGPGAGARELAFGLVATFVDALLAFGD